MGDSFYGVAFHRVTPLGKHAISEYGRGNWLRLLLFAEAQLLYVEAQLLYDVQQPPPPHEHLVFHPRRVGRTLGAWSSIGCLSTALEWFWIYLVLIGGGCDAGLADAGKNSGLYVVGKKQEEDQRVVERNLVKINSTRDFSQ
ncbi:hypothetical protein [Candidatus Igneacidithiobacillus taiwanensis]|uniref:hypothetical protein n=1 Tax=Candidatus Igneacidithiobacillus taiwanensis TaxID=1945924 RepID=UPI0028A0C2D0|nr:hypothetical protein [Candidatus Igneacidithiobacillus taiwanensis]